MKRSMFPLRDTRTHTGFTALKTHTPFPTACTHSFIHTHSLSDTQRSPHGKAHLPSLSSCSLITVPLTSSNYPRRHATTRFNQSDKVISLTLQATRKELFLFAPPPRPPILKPPLAYHVHFSFLFPPTV